MYKSKSYWILHAVVSLVLSLTDNIVGDYGMKQDTKPSWGMCH